MLAVIEKNPPGKLIKMEVACVRCCVYYV